MTEVAEDELYRPMRVLFPFAVVIAFALMGWTYYTHQAPTTEPVKYGESAVRG